MAGTLLESAESDYDRTAARSTKSFDVAFKEFRLNNGLRVILAEDHSAPYSICVTYNVGSRDERGRTDRLRSSVRAYAVSGVGECRQGGAFILIQNNGGSANGTTNAERTNYFETLPANQLELGIFLEADRMRALNITQANLDNQRQTVQRNGVELRQPPLRENLRGGDRDRLCQFRIPAFRYWIDGRPKQRDGSGRR